MVFSFRIIIYGYIRHDQSGAENDRAGFFLVTHFKLCYNNASL
ncbi:hypothetical protein HMPREF0080_01436 [Anaeroglobus geminatus F0357]|uniref:Uncharacterized protein n=1 Tax=Anaeroglobus geminatus F0357 TaxID=861450 RepID=G9YIE5_9FIRM|nr:hypothetical protein HMPREF0080_01436 [Anaeroglobus geminatus F0357]